jgi:hypothetical protein
MDQDALVADIRDRGYEVTSVVTDESGDVTVES